MTKLFAPALAPLSLLALAAFAGGPATQEPSLDVSAFAVDHAVVVAATPEQAYDAFTGDVTAWWDHSFAEHPRSLVIEPHPGGRFVETFGDGPDGALHATVSYARRGEGLDFTGPLGFGALGLNFDMVHQLRFEAVEGGTRVSIRVRGLGTVQPGWEQAVQRVWHHFLDERFKPFVEGEL